MDKEVRKLVALIKDLKREVEHAEKFKNDNDDGTWERELDISIDSAEGLVETLKEHIQALEEILEYYRKENEE